MDDFTRVPRKLKRRWQARETTAMVLGWLTLIVVFLYGIGFIAEQFSDVEWP